MMNGRISRSLSLCVRYRSVEKESRFAPTSVGVTHPCVCSRTIIHPIQVRSKLVSKEIGKIIGCLWRSLFTFWWDLGIHKPHISVQSLPMFCFPDIDLVEVAKKMKTETYCFVFTDLQAQVHAQNNLNFR